MGLITGNGFKERIMIRVVPGDIVYIVLNPKKAVVLKAKVNKVVMDEYGVSYFVDEGKIVCENGSDEFKKGQRYQLATAFHNANLDTGVGIGDSKLVLFVFTDKSECKEFLKGYMNYGK